MDLYTLDSTFKPLDVLDETISKIWTERFNDHGEVVVEVADTPKNRAKLTDGVFLSIGEQSNEAMIVESKTSSRGILTATGPSLVGFLKNRISRDTWYSSAKSWFETGTPSWIIGQMVRRTCMESAPFAASPAQGDGEIISGLYVDGENQPGPTVTLSIPYGSVFDTVQSVASSYSIGFSMVPESIYSSNGYMIRFYTYLSRDLTSTQSINPVVRFEPAMDSLANVKSFSSISGYKNVAYAFAPNSSAQNVFVGYATSDDGNNARNFERRTLLVNADDLNDQTVYPMGQTLQTVLDQKARDALANNNYARYVDGEVVPQSAFKYMNDYRLGDIVELSTPTGGSSRARITEYIRAEDESGYKEYPTLSVIT